MIDRNCGECVTCCIVTEIKENDFYKAPNETCKYLNKECCGCSVFGTEKKPIRCDVFNCAWLKGFGDLNDRPDLNDVMIAIDKFNGGTWVFVLETKKGAYLTTGKNIIIDIANNFNFPVIVVDYDSKYPNDKGDYVIIRKDLEYRAKSIMDDFICEYSEDMNVYKLIIE
jgi:hypothetical protein